MGVGQSGNHWVVVDQHVSQRGTSTGYRPRNYIQVGDRTSRHDLLTARAVPRGPFTSAHPQPSFSGPEL